ncbi:MAG: M48 family metallopeptidase [Clostridiales Family XIII bacterium]|jgi:predicted metal-dependent hydrolase|nr:M48 family metallopeptidase [Clostridiales Family XIII bacterium]
MNSYTLVRSRRRTAVIYIRNGGVEVRAPLNMPKREIDKFVASKNRWITERLAQSQAHAERRAAFSLNYGDTVTFRGGEHPLVAKNDRRAGFDSEHFYLPPGFTPEQIKQAVVRIYRLLSKRYFTERVAHYSELMGVAPTVLRISGAKTRWGSCSAKKSLNFSWRLALADDEVIDYVVVHELAHIRELNHSPRFWAIVAGVLPDYKKRQARLKDLQRRLSGEDWE